MKKSSFNLILFLLSSILCNAQVVDKEPGCLTADGPYIFRIGTDSARVVSVSVNGAITDSVGLLPKEFQVISHDSKYSFSVKLHDISRESCRLEETAKTFIISDPHGRMDCLVSALQGGGVIDGSLNWSFGPNRVVLIGDVMDRGDDVVQIFWLLYKLEEEAHKAGGSLSFVYGNHESMILAGDLRYCREKYKSLADSLGMSVPGLFSPSSETGRYLASRNTMMTIGDNLFVHAGLSSDFAAAELEMEQVNSLVSANIFKSKEERKKTSDTVKLLFGNYGPLWYRGFFSTSKRFGPMMKEETLQEILGQYGVSRVFIGHTISKDVRTILGGGAIAVDVDAKINYDKRRTRGVLIENGKAYAVYDSGRRKTLRY